MCTLKNKICELRKEIQLITSNLTLDAFDLEYCDILDMSCENDSFIKDRVKKAIFYLNKIKSIDYNTYIKSAYECYNEAITYVIIKNKNVTIHNVRESITATPDFEIKVNNNTYDPPKTETVYMEVKTLAFGGGNTIYKQDQEKALCGNISLEEQRKKGKQVCFTDREISPFNFVGFTEEIKKIRNKIENNIKNGQFTYNGGNNTVLFIDMSQIDPFCWDINDCLPIYPNIIKKGITSGRLWNICFGKEDDYIYLAPEFDGKEHIICKFESNGILNIYPDIKGIIFGFGRSEKEKKLYGLYRAKDENLSTTLYIKNICDFHNNDLNQYGYEYYDKIINYIKTNISKY